MAENHGKLTLEALLARREQSQADKLEFHNFFVKELEGELVIQKIPLRRVLGIIDATDPDSLAENLDKSSELIYECCPVMKNQKLQEAFACAEPFDVVPAVFDDNLGVINRVSEFILSLYGLADKPVDAAVDEVKN